MRLGERAIVGGRTVPDARVVPVLDGADGQATDAAEARAGPGVGAGRRERELRGDGKREGGGGGHEGNPGRLGRVLELGHGTVSLTLD